MMPGLFDQRGNRKYLIARERLAFVYVASQESELVSTFCLTMAFTGARISEVLALTVGRIDAADEAVVFETLKQRKKKVFPRSSGATRVDSASDGIRSQQKWPIVALGSNNNLEES